VRMHIFIHDDDLCLQRDAIYTTLSRCRSPSDQFFSSPQASRSTAGCNSPWRQGQILFQRHGCAGYYNIYRKPDRARANDVIGSLHLPYPFSTPISSPRTRYVQEPLHSGWSIILFLHEILATGLLIQGVRPFHNNLFLRTPRNIARRLMAKSLV
jgi:hypothetical protein